MQVEADHRAIKTPTERSKESLGIVANKDTQHKHAASQRSRREMARREEVEESTVVTKMMMKKMMMNRP